MLYCSLFLTYTLTIVEKYGETHVLKTSIIMFKAYHNELSDSLPVMFNMYVLII